MLLILPADILTDIHRHAAADYPHECSGILLGRPTPRHTQITHALPAPNLADPAHRHNRYLLDPRALLEADRRAHAQSLEIIGFYHSHPDHPARPSPTDLAAAWPIYCYLILTITPAGPGEITAWQFPASNQPPLQIPIHSCIPTPPA